MNVSALVNDTQPEAKPPQASTAGRGGAPHVSPPPLALPNGSYAPAQTRATPGQQTPGYTPSSASVASQGPPQSRGLTPLHTPAQAPGPGQYPFPTQHQPGPSPATAHPGSQQYRTYEPYSATTPGARPSSHGYSAQHSPAPGIGSYPSALSAPNATSLSPTPSSQHSQTPHSVRQSPMAAMNHPPSLQHAPHSQYHHSQPTTPLGPPQVPHRHSNQPVDLSSPYHQRTYSSTSNGIASASPAQHQPNIANLVDSPGLYHRPSPSRRQTSEFRGSVDRDRSVSVSPKTMVPPRPPSLGSRHSSQQDMHSARSSLQPSASVASASEIPGHVYASAQPQSGSYPSSEVVQGYSRTSGGGQSANGNSLSPADNKLPLQHQTQKMGMSHLLAPTQHAQQQSPLQNGSYLALPAKASSHVQTQPDPQSQASQEQAHVKATPLAKEPSSATESTLSSSHRGDGMNSTSPAPRPPMKRSAESEPSSEPLAKRGRRRKYTERPVWASLSHKNPRYGQPGVAPNGTAQSTRPQHQHQHIPQRNDMNGGTPTAQAQTQQNVARANVDEGSDKPWLRDVPLDEELINARNVLGKWEKSLKWHVPIPPMTKAVMDWLYQNLEQNSDVGIDPREGSIEIEAKIGTLIDKNTGQRCALPVENATVISIRENKRYQFDSQMNEREHESMNKFLNEAVQRSRAEKGREPIMYEHIRETDSFKVLSELGLKSLPAAAQKRQLQREMKLRTSVQDKTGKVSARIVKVPIGENLHIFGANEPYDVRISMNLEINLDKPGLDPEALTEEPTADKPAPPKRRKDRLSYKHLSAYHVDLTRVDVKGMPPKYELELEVNAAMLRQQIDLAKNQQKNAYMEVVDGFLANMLWLMKQQRL